MGLSPREFWGLTWYEWGFYAIKLHDRNREREQIKDLFLGVTRIMIADFKNAHGVTPKLEPKDIFRLSFEAQQKEEERAMTFKEAKALYGSRIKKDVG